MSVQEPEPHFPCAYTPVGRHSCIQLRRVDQLEAWVPWTMIRLVKGSSRKQRDRTEEHVGVLCPTVRVVFDNELSFLVHDPEWPDFEEHPVHAAAARTSVEPNDELILGQTMVGSNEPEEQVAFAGFVHDHMAEHGPEHPRRSETENWSTRSRPPQTRTYPAHCL